MSQHHYEFNTPNGTVYRPVPLLVDATRRKMDLFIFKFPDAIFLVHEAEEKIDSIQLSLRHKGFVDEVMDAQMVESDDIKDK